MQRRRAGKPLRAVAKVQRRRAALDLRLRTQDEEMAALYDFLRSMLAIADPASSETAIRRVSAVLRAETDALANSSLARAQRKAALRRMA